MYMYVFRYGSWHSGCDGIHCRRLHEPFHGTCEYNVIFLLHSLAWCILMYTCTCTVKLRPIKIVLCDVDSKFWARRCGGRRCWIRRLLMSCVSVAKTMTPSKPSRAKQCAPMTSTKVREPNRIASLILSNISGFYCCDCSLFIIFLKAVEFCCQTIV